MRGPRLGGHTGREWRLVDPREAVSLVAASLDVASGPAKAVYRSLMLARGRAAQLLVSPGPWPPHPRVELDGCAVNAELASGALRIAGRLRPHSAPGVLRDPRSECVWVDTGAPLPLGANAVVPREELDVSGGSVRLASKPRPWGGVSMPASDASTGDPLVAPGRLVTPEVLASAASSGYPGILVDDDRPRVCIASFGDELCEPWEGCSVRESNRYQLAARLESLGLEVVDLGIRGDSVGEAERAAEDALEHGCSVLVTSGGTSVGLSDPLPAFLASRGSLLVHGLNIRPGRPTAIGYYRGLLVVALPGNPRSSGNVAETVLEPLLTLLGVARGRGVAKAYLAYTLANRSKRPSRIPVAVVKGGDSLLAVPVAPESFMVRSWALASGYVTIGPSETLTAGEEVEVAVTSDAFRAAIDAADSGLASINGRPLIRVPLSRAEEAVQSASSAGVPVIAPETLMESRKGRAVAERPVVEVESPHDPPAWSATEASAYGYGGGVQLERAEGALLMALNGYTPRATAPLPLSLGLPSSAATNRLYNEVLSVLNA